MGDNKPNVPAQGVKINGAGEGLEMNEMARLLERAGSR